MDNRTTVQNTARHNAWKAKNKEHRKAYMDNWVKNNKKLIAQLAADWYKRKGKDHYQKTKQKHHKINRECYAKSVGLTRSEIMARIKSVSMLEVAAKPVAEFVAGCRLVHQPQNIFGKPDYANKPKKICVFIDGDFWHGRKGWKCPKTNSEFWLAKITRNKERAKEVNKALKKDGWIVIRLWETDIRKLLK